METLEKEGKYIYCIIGSGKPQSFGLSGIGERGDEVHTISYNNIAAVVSNSPIKKYSVSSDNTMAHERAIERVMEEHTVLPVRFVTIAESEEKVKRILEKEHDKFKELLLEMKGKKEVGIKAIFKKEIVYKEILEEHEGIRKLKEMITSKPPQKTHYQRMEIGKMVEIALDKEKEKHKNAILNVLEPLSEEVKTNSVYGERMIINAAFLIKNTKEPEFDQNVQELDAKYGEKIKFKYVGPIPPYNFVNLAIETGEY